MKKILLIRIDALGDLILTIPAMRAILEFYTDAEIDVVVKKKFVPLMQEIKGIHTVIAWEKIPPLLQVRKKEYDIAFDMTPASTFDSSLLLFFVRAKEKIGYNVGIRKYWITTQILPKGLQYERDMVLEICKQMNIPIKEKKLFFPIYQKQKKEVKEKIENILITHFGQKNKPKKIIAIHPSASQKEKIWPMENFIELINKLIKNHQNIAFVLIGTKEEKHFCEEINNKLITKQVNLAGELSIIDLGAFLSNCDLLLCNNSGPMHIGAAVGTPIILVNMVSSNDRWTPKEGIIRICNASSEDLEQGKRQKSEMKWKINTDDVYTACLEVLGYKKY